MFCTVYRASATSTRFSSHRIPPSKPVHPHDNLYAKLHGQLLVASD